MKLHSNRELYEYLVLLASQLEGRGSKALSRGVAPAARTAESANPGSHFGVCWHKRMASWARWSVPTFRTC
jgi:hypothetical protein